MRYAVVSDIHANWQAWRAVWEDARSLRVDAVICLGDVVGYGPKPQRVLDSVREVCSGLVTGNHDAAVCRRLDDSIFNEHAREVVAWTRERMGAESLEYLSELPLAIEDGEILFTHAEAVEPGRFDYIEDLEKAAENLKAKPQYRLIFIGHTHFPAVYSVDAEGAAESQEATQLTLVPERRYLINVGSVGEPRDSTSVKSSYVVYDDESGTIDFRKVDFDTDAYRVDLTNEGLEIQPYFLRVLDQELADSNESDRMISAPKAPILVTPQGAAITSKTFSPTTRLFVGSSAAQPITYSKPVLTAKSAPDEKKSSPMVATIAIVAVLALLGAAFFVWQWLSDPKEDLVIDPTKDNRTESSVTPPPLRAGLVAYWEVDETSPFAPDLGGASDDEPRLLGRPLPGSADGLHGKALDFNGRQRVEWGEPRSYGPWEGGLSVSCWYSTKRSQLVGREYLIGNTIFRKNVTPRGWAIFSELDGISVIVSDGKSVVSARKKGLGKMEVGTWRHVMVQVDPTQKKLILFHNGQPVVQKSIKQLKLERRRGVFKLGVGAPPAKAKGIINFRGMIDELAIWNRPLTLPEIGKLYQAEETTKTPLSMIFSP